MLERKPGLDLLRCFAFFLVVIFHSFLNNGYYYEPQTGIWMLLAGSVRWFSTACIGLFLMLTGWLKAPSLEVKKAWRGLPAVLVGYILAAVISIPVRHFILGEEQSFTEWFFRLLRFNGVYYGWYVEMYVGLILLSPFINRLLKSLNRSYQLLLCGIMLVLTALPGELKFLPDYWRELYPLTYYILGATVRRLEIKLPPAVGFSCAMVIALVLGAVTVGSTDGTIYDAAAWEFADFWILMISFLLFLTLYHVQIPKALQKPLRFASGGCYGGYLLSHLLDAQCYKLFPQWQAPEYYGAVFLVVTVPVFVLSILAGFLLERIAGLVAGRRRAV